MFLSLFLLYVCPALALTITQPASSQEIIVSEQFTIKWKSEQNDPTSSIIYLTNSKRPNGIPTVLAQNCKLSVGEQNVRWPTSSLLLNTPYKILFYDPYTDRFVGQSNEFSLTSNSTLNSTSNSTASGEADQEGSDHDHEETPQEEGKTDFSEVHARTSLKDSIIEAVVPLVVVALVLCSGVSYCFTQGRLCFKRRRRSYTFSQEPKDIEETELINDERTGTWSTIGRIDTDSSVSLQCETLVNSPLLGVGRPPPALVSGFGTDLEAGGSGRHSPPLDGQPAALATPDLSLAGYQRL